jgi:hypothetical protein
LIGGGCSKLKIFFRLSAARRLRLFLIGGGSKILKLFADPAATALLFLKISAAAAAQPTGLHLYLYRKTSVRHFIILLTFP